MSGTTASCVASCTANYEKKCYGITNTIWSRNSCGAWESKVEDCVAEGKICENDICVIAQQQICGNKPARPSCANPAGNPVWQDYPTCSWDVSSCADPCAPSKKYEACSNGNVWWFDNCNKATTISNACGPNQECLTSDSGTGTTVSICKDKCVIDTTPICDGNTIITKDSCGNIASTVKTCADTEICRLGNCYPQENKICASKPNPICSSAVWNDWPTCSWDESSCNVVDPCQQNPTSPECVDCKLPANENLSQCKQGLKFTQSQVIRIWIGGILALIGLVILLIGAII